MHQQESAWRVPQEFTEPKNILVVEDSQGRSPAPKWIAHKRTQTQAIGITSTML